MLESGDFVMGLSDLLPETRNFAGAGRPTRPKQTLLPIKSIPDIRVVFGEFDEVLIP